MLASCYLRGFKEGVGRAFKPCRICYINRDQVDSCREGSTCSIDYKDGYSIQVVSLEESHRSQTQKDLFKEHGIVQDWDFSLIVYLVPTMYFSHDLMHVSYEGI